MGQLNQVLDFILQNVQFIDKDFEIKRLTIGLATIVLSPDLQILDQARA